MLFYAYILAVRTLSSTFYFSVHVSMSTKMEATIDCFSAWRQNAFVGASTKKHIESRKFCMDNAPSQPEFERSRVRDKRDATVEFATKITRAKPGASVYGSYKQGRLPALNWLVVAVVVIVVTYNLWHGWILCYIDLPKLVFFCFRWLRGFAIGSFSTNVAI